MIRKISYLKKPISQMTIQDSAKMLNKIAQKSKDATLEYTSLGLKGKVTPTFIKQSGASDTFEKSGVIKPRFLNAISAKYELGNDATISDYLAAVLKALKK